jgi:dsDNA-specific endonuclease/ATPase MutS2
MDEDDDFDPEAPVEVPIEDVLDLHPFAPRDIAALVADYLDEAAARGLEEVRIIHGKGKGVQQRIVHGVLGKHPLVARFGLATDASGWGATVVTLQRKSS